MKRMSLTDPFTGLPFDTLIMSDGSIIANLPFHGNVTFPYDEREKSYTIPARLFEPRETLTLRECAKLLGVSRMRVSRMCSDRNIKSAKINGVMVIDKKSVSIWKKEHSHDRMVGRPSKETTGH